MNQRMKWDAEAAFKRIDAFDGVADLAAANDAERMKVPYTPPSNIGPERLAQLRKYEPPAKHGRDIASLVRYHEAHKKGRTDDDCLREKFGGQPLPSAVTKPHGKDIDTPWPKCTKMAHSEEYHLWRTETEGIWFDSAGLKGVCGTPSFTCAMTECNRIEVSRAEMAGFLEAHGHKDVAAQLRGKVTAGADEFEPTNTRAVIGDVLLIEGHRYRVERIIGGAPGPYNVRAVSLDTTGPSAAHFDCGWLESGTYRILKRPVADNAIPRADVATGGGRVWKDKYNGWHGVWLNGRSFGRSATCAMFEDITASRDLPKDTSAYEVELHGPERDAILAECRKAMGL